MTPQRELPDIIEAVTTELLAHGEFSSGANNYANARIAACKVIDIVTRLRATPPGSPLEREGERVAIMNERDTILAMLVNASNQRDCFHCDGVTIKNARDHQI